MAGITTGTVKQIAWAESIKQEKITYFTTEVAKYSGADDHADLVERLNKLVAGMDKKTDAKWWIDNRHDILTKYIDWLIGG